MGLDISISKPYALIILTAYSVNRIQTDEMISKSETEGRTETVVVCIPNLSLYVLNAHSTVNCSIIHQVGKVF